MALRVVDQREMVEDDEGHVETFLGTRWHVDPTFSHPGTRGTIDLVLQGMDPLFEPSAVDEPRQFSALSNSRTSTTQTFSSPWRRRRTTRFASRIEHEKTSTSLFDFSLRQNSLRTNQFFLSSSLGLRRYSLLAGCPKPRSSPGLSQRCGR